MLNNARGVSKIEYAFLLSFISFALLATTQLMTSDLATALRWAPSEHIITASAPPSGPIIQPPHAAPSQGDQLHGDKSTIGSADALGGGSNTTSD